MSPRFLAVVTGSFLALTLVSSAVLVLTGPDRGGLVVFVSVQGLNFVLVLRATLLATVPQRDLAAARLSRRQRHRWTATGLILCALAAGVGSLLALGPVLGSAVSLVAAAGALPLVRAIDRYAARTADQHAVDVVRPGDVDRLAPEAVRAELLRRASHGVVAGALAAVVVGPLVALIGSGALAGAIAGASALIAVSTVTLGLGSLGLSWAAGRRLSALMSEDPPRAKRLRKAVLRRRTADLAETDRRDAHAWARLAEPAFLLQFLGQLPVLVLVPGLQAVQLISDPDDDFRRWLVGVMLAVMLPLYALGVRQWLRVRSVARDDDRAVSGP